MGKQTLEEASWRFKPENRLDGEFLKQWSSSLRHAFKEGAKWQAERMYSEEEVLDLLHRRSFDLTHKKDTKTTNEWFEQFKKK